MKRIILLLAALILSTNAIAKENSAIDLTAKKTKNDSVIIQYSLFSEYHKNRDFLSALPFGWRVIEMDPDKFAKWVYYKMEDCLVYKHDSTDISEEEQAAVTDTLLYLYDIAMEHYTDSKPYFQLKKALYTDIWKDASPESVIAEYEKAVNLDSSVSTYYYHRLGIYYKKMSDEDPVYKTKALDLYSYLSEIDPDNPQWNTELEGLVENIDELVDIVEKAWRQNTDDLAKAWKFAAVSIQAGMHERAIEPLEFLVEKAPETPNYWSRLASAYHKTDQIDKAIDAYKKLTELQPENKEHWLNLGISYKDKGYYSSARSQFQKANDVGDNWALPVFYEGLLYEMAARGCGSYEFMDKLVYQLAANTYRRAYNIDPTLTQANERVKALSGSVPSQEDYFFKKYNSGQKIKIEGNCYDWINRTVTVP